MSPLEFCEASLSRSDRNVFILSVKHGGEMEGPLDQEALRLRLDKEIERAEKSVAFWRVQVRLQTDTPFDATVVRTLDSHKQQLNGLLEARRLLDLTENYSP